ncbi:hypothetical protein [Priestia taiwanensis]|uniref:Uncharacterized protein n=1 Tax=Priestia taiwanensis TaxID=1347902 RepID=A0A917AS43_9BACI|nr:hypothetical protein [Priestia taiwanensis]MBM7364111.1 hypothetical protein [Priestia taiwanensis]GGE71667.1 hypothetical protein GCM10007140_22040 [Priestia taiwanensis]
MNKNMIKILAIVVSIFITIALIYFIATKVSSFMKDASEPVDDGQREVIAFQDIDLKLLSEQSNHALVDSISYTVGSNEKKVRYEMYPSFFQLLNKHTTNVHEEEQPNTFKVYIKFAKRPNINAVTDNDPRLNGKECTIYIDKSLLQQVEKIGPGS